MKRVNIVLSDVEGIEEGDVIGVDHGAYLCSVNNIPMKVAIGDFDSVSKEELQLIKRKTKETIVLNTDKDDTDFYAAYRLCEDYDEIVVLGGLGGRRDHEYMHLLTTLQDSRVILKNKQNKIQRLDSGIHIVSKDLFQYISFFALTNCHISLKGFKYSLTHQYVNPTSTNLTSNEIVDQMAEIKIEGGSLLMIQSNP